MKSFFHPYFVWQGIDAKGFKIKGKQVADDLSHAKTLLEKRNITVLRITRKIDIQLISKNRAIKQQDISGFILEISTLISAGIPLVTALGILLDMTNKPAMKTLIQTLKQQVENGCLFSDALQSQAKHFDELSCHLVRAGEMSGTLDVILKHLAAYQEKIISLKQKIKKALFYPLIVLIAAFMVTSAMLVFVLPQFARLFQSVGAELPMFTRLVMHGADFLQAHGGMMLLVIILLIAAFKFTMQRSQKWRRVFERCLLHLPFIGKMLMEAIVARCFRTLSITLQAGLPLLDSLHLTAKVAINHVYQQAFVGIAQSVINGQSLQVSLKKTALFPPRVVQMLSIGEESGRLDYMLGKIADYFEGQVDYKVQNLSQLLEPALMIFLCVVVGGLVIAMYLPIFRLGSVI